ncbi:MULTISPECIES: TerB family tellurite resistance protein [Undibacterium]|uniref:tellurite resistance TerB family protein n=1 Tax=Undibacterium TaxID=401469 RepID=UPI001C9A3334|nr:MULTISPECIES: TerB family tellurite resistance protein [Undibacterium]
MRTYRVNSPEAMARIVALSMLVDGGLDKSELDVVHRYGIVERLGLSEEQFEKIVHHLCEDMLQCADGSHYGQIEMANPAIDSILEEIQDPQLRKQLLRIMLAIVDADDRLSDGEAVLIDRALQCWTLDLVAISDTPLSAQLSSELEHHQMQQRDYSASKPVNILETHY